MSVVAPPADAPPPPWMLGVIGATAAACVILGALVVEPAIHRLASDLPSAGSNRSPDRQSVFLGRVEVGEALLQGRYVARSGQAFEVDGSVIASGDARLQTAPHHLADAGRPATDRRTFAGSMNIPPAAQVEVRRVVRDGNTGLCGNEAVGWVVLAPRQDGFRLLPVRKGSPPGASLADDRLCPVLDLTR